MPQKTIIARELLEEASEAGPFPAHLSDGRGIVVCAGGPRMLTNAYVLVRALRELHACKLPIEIWHLGPQEMPAFLADIFIKLGCRIVDGAQDRNKRDDHITDGWQLKAYALKHSAFEEVILLDADQVPVRDPEYLFDWPQYKETGAIFWPDIIELAAANPIWDMLGLPTRDMRSWESGQLCVNRCKHWQAICVTFAMNRRAEVFYQLVYGDKDTFLFGWLLTESAHEVIPHLPFQSERFMCQRDFEGSPLFQHRSNCKWSLAEENIEPDGFQYSAECAGFLNDLSGFWDGRIFNPPSQSAAARRLEQELIRQGCFHYMQNDHEAIELDLLPGNQIGRGRSFSLRNWYVQQAEEGFQLVFCDSQKPFAILLYNNDKWVGKTSSIPVQKIFLAPLQHHPQSDMPPHTQGGLVAELVLVCADKDNSSGKDMEKLSGALELLTRLQPQTVKDIYTVAERYAETEPSLSKSLKQLASELETKTSSSEEKVVRSPFEMFGDGKHYLPR